MTGHVMPAFPDTLIGLGPVADLGCKIVFTKTSVTVFHPDGHPLLLGWRDETGPRLWHFLLTAEAAQTALANASPQPHIQSTTEAAHVAVDTTSHPPQLSTPPPPPCAPPATLSRPPRKRNWRRRRTEKHVSVSTRKRKRVSVSTRKRKPVSVSSWKQKPISVSTTASTKSLIGRRDGTRPHIDVDVARAEVYLMRGERDAGEITAARPPRRERCPGPAVGGAAVVPGVGGVLLAPRGPKGREATSCRSRRDFAVVRRRCPWQCCWVGRKRGDRVRVARVRATPETVMDVVNARSRPVEREQTAELSFVGIHCQIASSFAHSSCSASRGSDPFFLCKTVRARQIQTR